MSDFILTDGDTVIFETKFGLATVVIPQDGKLIGTGKSEVEGKKVCIEGDEKSVSVSDCNYTAGQFKTPGKGTLKIDGLEDDQKARKMKDGGKAVLLKGSEFKAIFEVTDSAKGPNNTSDQNKKYMGKGEFTTANTKLKAN